MKISLKTHGGWGAPIYLNLPPKTVDVGALPKEAAAVVARLVDAARNAPAPPKAQARPASVPTPMSYTITVEDDGEPIVLHQSDTMSPAFEALLNWLNDYFAPQVTFGRPGPIWRYPPDQPQSI